MDPATLGLIGSAVSGITGFVGQIAQGQAQAGAAEYQAAVARNNQIIAQQNASRAAQSGAVAAQRQDFKTRAVVGAIEAGQGASGIDVGSTTSKEVRESAYNVGRLDTATVMANALNQARAYEAQSMNFGAQSELDKYQASNARTAGMLGGFGSLIGGATGFADKWSRYQNEGVKVF